MCVSSEVFYTKFFGNLRYEDEKSGLEDMKKNYEEILSSFMKSVLQGDMFTLLSKNYTTKISPQTHRLRGKILIKLK